MESLVFSCCIKNPSDIIDFSLFLFYRNILFKRGGNFSSYLSLTFMHIY